MPSPSDSRRLPPLTTSSPGGDRWQLSDYGMPTSHGYPNNIRSPTASYPTTYVSYPSSNQASFYSYHLPTNDHHSMGVPENRSLFDYRDPRSSSPSSRGSSSSQVSAPSYTPPPASSEEPTNKRKRKRVDAAQLEVLNETFNRTAFPSTEERHALAKALDMPARKVQIWSVAWANILFLS
jgi:homeobox protein YOX1/YHP1